MKKIVIAALATLAAASSMAAQNNVGSCGWGSKVFQGQSGVAPQVLAVTTNGTSGNQTFGITFGTSGCTQDGVVSSTWKTAMYIDGNDWKMPFAGVGSRSMSSNRYSLAPVCWLIGIPRSISWS